MRSNRLRRFTRPLLALALGIVVAAVLGEVVVRIARIDVWLIDPLIGLQSADPSVHRQSERPELLYALAPDVDTELSPCSEYAPEPRAFRTNSLGFRDEPRVLTRPPGTLRIVCLGGSNTYGAAVSNHETWPTQLQQVLRERVDRPVEVWNCGVAGYMNRQKVLVALDLLDSAAPDLILLQAHNMGRRYRLMNEDLGRLLELSPGIWAENLRHAPQPGTGLPWKAFRHCALWRAGVAGLNHHQRSREDASWGGDLGEAEDARGVVAVEGLARVVQGRASVVVFIPPAGYGATGLRDLGLPTVDLSAVDQPFGEEGIDPHPGARVYRWYAEQLADRLIGGGCLDHPTDCQPTLRVLEQTPGGEEAGDVEE